MVGELLPGPGGGNVVDGVPFQAGSLWYVRFAGHLYGPFPSLQVATTMAAQIRQAASRTDTQAQAQDQTQDQGSTRTSAPAQPPAQAAPSASAPAKAQTPAPAASPSQGAGPAREAPAVARPEPEPQTDQFGNPLETVGPMGVTLRLHTYSPTGVPIYQDPVTLRRYSYLPGEGGDLSRGRWVEGPVVVVPGEVPATAQGVRDAVNPPDGPRDVPDAGQRQNQGQGQGQGLHGLPEPLPGMSIVFGFAGPVGAIPNPQSPSGFDYYVAVDGQWVKMAGPPNPPAPPNPPPPPVSPAVSREWQEYMRQNPEWARMAIGGGQQGVQAMQLGGTVEAPIVAREARTITVPRPIAHHQLGVLAPLPLQFSSLYQGQPRGEALASPPSPPPLQFSSLYQEPPPGAALASPPSLPPPPPSTPLRTSSWQAPSLTFPSSSPSPSPSPSLSPPPPSARSMTPAPGPESPWSNLTRVDFPRPVASPPPPSARSMTPAPGPESPWSNLTRVDFPRPVAPVATSLAAPTAYGQGGDVPPPPPPPPRPAGPVANALVGEGKAADGSYRREVILTPRALASGGVFQARRPTLAALPPGTVVVPVKETRPAAAALDRAVPPIPEAPPPARRVSVTAGSTGRREPARAGNGGNRRNQGGKR